MASKSAITMKIVKKGDKTYQNFYLFGILVNPYESKQRYNLYLCVKTYLETNNIDIPVVDLTTNKKTCKSTTAKSKKTKK